MKDFNYRFDKVNGNWHPAQYPGEKSDQWVLPDDIRTDYGKLNSVIEIKYVREYLKICAFYNKLFPSLKTSNWVRSSYNVPPFTAMDQERSDTGTGISSNYLKQIVDQVVSRLGTVSFEPALISDVPTLEYIIYKDEVERILRKTIRNIHLNKLTMEVFHDAAVLGYSHVFIDPVLHTFVKANDYEVGLFEAQFNRKDIKQMLYRDYAFPVTSLVPYLAHCSSETQEKVVEQYGSNTTCDFKMFFDCINHKVHITINGTTLEAIEYPFDNVQMVTFSWDIGFSRVTSTSLFDLLYPIQRELNKLNAKIQQLIRIYKGPVPVFPNDVDLAMKSISNGTGEALYVNSARPIDNLITVINPTPLDPALSGEKTNLKTEMYELAGIQQTSFDMENMRSAAAVIALDQTRDIVFQAQLEGISTFIKELFNIYVTYQSVLNIDTVSVEWEDVRKLMNEAVIDLKPVTITDPMGNKGSADGQEQPDYQQIQIARATIAVMKGELIYDDIPFTIDAEQLKKIVAVTVIKLDALNITIPDSMNQFLIDAFIDDVRLGKVPLGSE